MPYLSLLTSQPFRPPEGATSHNIVHPTLPLSSPTASTPTPTSPAIAVVAGTPPSATSAAPRAEIPPSWGRAPTPVARAPPSPRRRTAASTRCVAPRAVRSPIIVPISVTSSPTTTASKPSQRAPAAWSAVPERRRRRPHRRTTTECAIWRSPWGTSTRSTPEAPGLTKPVRRRTSGRRTPAEPSPRQNDAHADQCPIQLRLMHMRNCILRSVRRRVNYIRQPLIRHELLVHRHL